MGHFTFEKHPKIQLCQSIGSLSHESPIDRSIDLGFVQKGKEVREATPEK